MRGPQRSGLGGAAVAHAPRLLAASRPSSQRPRSPAAPRRTPTWRASLPTRSTTTGTSARSCRRTASSATAPTRRRAKRGCGSISASSPCKSCRRRRASYAIVPGNPERSELVRRIRSTNVDERMPPESTHKTLSAQQMAILEQWIENGAEYRPHWAFIEAERAGRARDGARATRCERHRSLRAEPPRARGTRAVRARRQGNA